MARAGPYFYLADAVNSFGNRLERDRTTAEEEARRRREREETFALQEQSRQTERDYQDRVRADDRKWTLDSDLEIRKRNLNDHRTKAEEDFERTLKQTQRLTDVQIRQKQADLGVGGDIDDPVARPAILEELAFAELALNGRLEVERKVQSLLGDLQASQAVAATDVGQENIARQQANLESLAAIPDIAGARAKDLITAQRNRLDRQKAQAVDTWANANIKAKDEETRKLAASVKDMKPDDKVSFFYTIPSGTAAAPEPQDYAAIARVEQDILRTESGLARNILDLEARIIPQVASMLTQPGSRLTTPARWTGIIGGTPGGQPPPGEERVPDANFDDPRGAGGGPPAPGVQTQVEQPTEAPRAFTLSDTGPTDEYGATGNTPFIPEEDPLNAQEFGASANFRQPGPSLGATLRQMRMNAGAPPSLTTDQAIRARASSPPPRNPLGLQQ